MTENDISFEYEKYLKKALLEGLNKNLSELICTYQLSENENVTVFEFLNMKFYCNDEIKSIEQLEDIVSRMAAAFFGCLRKIRTTELLISSPLMPEIKI